MQKKIAILYLFISMFFINTCYSNKNETKKNSKNYVDSLFNNKEYTQAQKIYADLYNNDKIESNDLLLKLALTYEGLGDITNAIFYLKKYTRTNPDITVDTHIEELASNNNLIGYKLESYDIIILFFFKNKLIITTSLLSITLLLFVIFLFHYIKKNKKRQPIIILLSFFIVITFLAINNITHPDTGIIKNNCLLMNEPSAGSKLQKKIKKGHKVIILDDLDIWFKVKLDDELYYIRKTNILII